MRGIAETDNVRLNDGEWKPIPKIAKTIPFGYEVKEEDPDTLYPIVLELEALEKAKDYRRQGYSLRETAEWLESVTGRHISHMGLKKRIISDNSRRSKAAVLRSWAAGYKKAIEDSIRWDQKHTQDIEIYKTLFDPHFDPAEWGKGRY
jgi:hypothetical protein